MRAFHLTICIGVIVTVLIGGARLYGKTHPNPNKPQALGFSQCAGKPCFLTIMPGITTWGEAATILSLYSNGKWSLNNSSTITPDQGYGVIIDSAISPTNSSVIKAIEVQYSFGSFLVVGDFVQQYGPPCLVGVSGNPKLLTLIYPYMMVQVIRGRNESRLSLESVVDYFQLIDPQARFGTVEDLCTFAKKIRFKAVVPWAGLRLWAVYWSMNPGS